MALVTDPEGDPSPPLRAAAFILGKAPSEWNGNIDAGSHAKFPFAV